MNIVNKLTLRHLKENKGRTVITTLGICVSVAMITAVFVAVASFLHLIGDVTVLSGGDYHAQYSNISQEQLSNLKNDDRISQTGVYITPENFSFKLENGKTDRMSTSEILVGDKTFLNQMVICEYDGRLPENEREIAVEQSFLDKNDIKAKVGDKISLAEGYRYLEENGEESAVKGDYHYPDEKFSSNDYNEYSITAILHNNSSTRLQPVLRGMSIAEKSGVVNASVKLEKFNYNSLKVIKAIAKEYKIDEYSPNKDYLESVLSLDENSTLAKSILPMTAVILIIIMIASVVLIYNAFGMSLAERVRYLGMLASVGATRKQKRKSIYYEGAVLGAIGIPVGIIAGIIGIGITLEIVGQKIVSTGMIAGVIESNLEMKTVVPFYAIVGIVLVSVLTIFISCFVPSRRASKITPIDAIRQTNDVKLKSKKLKSPKAVRKIFGYEGELAYKNLRRNARKSRVITGSIALSIILFVSCNYFCNIFVQANDMELAIPYNVQVLVAYEQREKLISELEKIDDVEKYYAVNNKFFYVGKDYDELKKNFQDKKFLKSAYKNFFNSPHSFYVNIIDDEAFNELCKNNNIDSSDFYGDKIKGVMLNDITHKGSGTEIFNDAIIGQTINYSHDVGETADLNYEISGLVKYDKDNYVCNLSPKNCLAFYIPFSQYFKASGNDANAEKTVLLGIEAKDAKAVAEKVSEIFESGNYLESYVANIEEQLQIMNTTVFIIQVFIYGFVTLITMITVANIINTISTNVHLRRKEFAMLKSVGTTPKGFRKMISLESVFYGLKAILWGIPLSLIVSVGLNKMLGADAIPFIFDWKMYLAVIFAVFVIIGLTMLYAVSKLKDDSIVETLKEEIN